MAEKDRLRNKEIRFKVTDNEKQLVMDKANYCGMSVSDYMREFVKHGAIIVFNRFNIRELTEELNKIGVNINQIAKNINTRGGIYDRQDMELLMKEFQEMQQLIYSKIWGME